MSIKLSRVVGLFLVSSISLNPFVGLCHSQFFLNSNSFSHLTESQRFKSLKVAIEFSTYLITLDK